LCIGKVTPQCADFRFDNPNSVGIRTLATD
jgi:hypothetical protein